jgi:hypothetical protein
MSVITRENEKLVVSGKTFDIKDTIKELGGRWDAARRVWTLLESEGARAKLLAASAAAEDRLKAERKAEREEKKRKAAYLLTPEGQAEARAEARAVVKSCLDEKAKTGKFHWICCEECVVVDWKRQHTSCKACAQWDGQSWNSFFVRGGLYTGT